MAHDALRWLAKWRLEKYRDGAADPYEVLEGDGNLVVNVGIQRVLDLMIGAGGTSYANANAYVGVGDSTTAAAVGQTDLQAATNKLRKVMDATYPSRAGQTVMFRSTFGTADANWTWNEWAVFNAATGATMLNRKVESLGAKTSGNTWILSVSIQLA